MNELSHLIDLDVEYYRSMYKDLSHFDNDRLIQHYYKHGYSEGRVCHPRARKEDLITAFSGVKSLEIGPFVNPLLTHENVKYLDVLSTEELITRAQKLQKPTERIRNIDFVSRDGSLRLVDERFDLVFSSHNFEHQPDPISHLIEVSAILNDGGIFAMLVPDARYCFDAELPLSKISDIFNAHIEKRKRHTLGSVIEHRALITHNDSKKHWENNSPKSYRPIDRAKVAAAISEFELAGHDYIDVHAWQFEPLSLSDILQTLIELKYIPFTRVSCRGPVYGRNEFSVELSK